MSSRRRELRGEEGAATVLVIALAVVVCSATMLVLAVAVLTVTRHRAESAADLAALSAARHAMEGERAACTVAQKAVAAQAARLEKCRLDGLDIVLTVAVTPPGRLAGFGDLRATARAGAR